MEHFFKSAYGTQTEPPDESPHSGGEPFPPWLTFFIWVFLFMRALFLAIVRYGAELSHQQCHQTTALVSPVSPEAPARPPGTTTDIPDTNAVEVTLEISRANCTPTKVPKEEPPDKPPPHRDKTDPLMEPVLPDDTDSVPTSTSDDDDDDDSVFECYDEFKDRASSRPTSDPTKVADAIQRIVYALSPPPSLEDKDTDPIAVLPSWFRYLIPEATHIGPVAPTASPPWVRSLMWLMPATLGNYWIGTDQTSNDEDVEAHVGEATHRASLRASVQQVHSDAWLDTSTPSHGYVVWDSGASHALTPFREDFIPGTFRPIHDKVVLGLATGSNIEGIGSVEWYIAAFDGTLRRFETTAYLVTAAKRRLLSPQAYIAEQRAKGASKEQTIEDDLMYALVGHDTEKPVIFSYHPSNNLPMMPVFRAGALDTTIDGLLSCVSDTENENLSPAQKTLLLYHFKLGHINMAQIQKILGTGRLASSRGKRLQHTNAAGCVIPRCASCQFGKQTRRSTPGVTGGTDRSPGALKTGHVLPGQCVSVDHFVCSTKGRLLNSMGKTDPNKMYCGGAIFVDHATGAVFIKEQVGMSGHETLKSKIEFERWLDDFGHVAQEYRTDNSTAFRNTNFTKELIENHQVTRFAGAGSHHSNGVAERCIRTIMGMARTMMLHAAIRWPDVSDAQLWPLAVQYSVHIYNRMPGLRNGLSPLDLLSRMKQTLDSLNDMHVFGCPVYVLDPAFADGKKIPKWTPRSRRGVFVGVSAQHSSESPLVLNLVTGGISPQYHVVFDDAFTTVSTDSDTVVDVSSEPWSNLFKDSLFQYPFDPGQLLPDFDPAWHDDEWHAQQQLRRTRIREPKRASSNPTKY
jgi:hypothetical protein